MEEFGFEIDNGFVFISDTKEHCYQQLIKFLQKHYIKIYGLKKTARGNSHDENWHSLYTFIDGDNPFSEVIEEVKSSKGEAYVDAPTVEFIDELSDEEIEKWSKEYSGYSGEEDSRILYAMRYGKEKCIIRISQTFPHKNNQSQTEWYDWDFRKENTILLATLTLLKEG